MLSLPGRLAERIMRPGVETTLWVLNARSRRRSRSCPESGRSGDWCPWLLPICSAPSRPHRRSRRSRIGR